MAGVLAARDQENLLHAHRTTAAGKPLNQNVRALHPKTPGNLRTPFRSANDENLPITQKGQKTFGQDGPSKLDKNAFVTPLAPRNRAPLGAKTTNPKGFQTPAPVIAKPGRTVQKPSTGARRSKRSKITVAQSEPVDADVLTRPSAEEEEPDFGYAPPPPVELPDPPIEFIENPELTEDLRHDHYVDRYFKSPKDENGLSLRLKKEEEEWRKFDEERMRESAKDLDKPVFPTFAELNKQVDDMIAAGPKKKRAPLSRVDSTEARSAVASLSESQSHLPSAAMKPTQASEQKKKHALPSARPKALGAREPPTPVRTKHAAFSKNTIGFPKAKKAPSIIPRSGALHTSRPVKIEQASVHPRDFRDLYGSPPEESDMWFRLKRYELLEEELAQDNDDAEESLFESDFFPFDNAKLDDEDFQLPMPE
ncbi:hypothetical protein H2200_012957 [Cladophialophora chaetospira]|uniref:Uncharacterized protein n=1 Tax=Cladophialophora chaetospira TaxID=386627 RepID=A0AA38WWH6_9EURO|nr:hypothetical protein H2200_012957 [Cladophialophora chaetospira]